MLNCDGYGTDKSGVIFGLGNPIRFKNRYHRTKFHEHNDSHNAITRSDDISSVCNIPHLQ